MHTQTLKTLRRSEHHHAQEHFSWLFPKQVGAYSLHGTSRAAAVTSFAIPELRIALDMGVIAHKQTPEQIFITHAHSDHVHELIYQLSRVKPPTIYVPKPSVQLLEDYLFAIKRLANHKEVKRGPNYITDFHLVGVEPGEQIELHKGSKRFFVEVFACEHSIPCVGYRFHEERKRLKPILRSLSGKEIAALRNQGSEINEKFLLPMFAYLGDTTTEVYTKDSRIEKMPVVITECSFLYEEHREAAQKSKHTLWSDLEGIVDANPETLFLLIHFSHRYTKQEIIQFFQKHKRPNLLPWI